MSCWCPLSSPCHADACRWTQPMGEVRSLFTRREAIAMKRCVECGCYVEKQGHKPECPNREED